MSVRCVPEGVSCMWVHADVCVRAYVCVYEGMCEVCMSCMCVHEGVCACVKACVRMHVCEVCVHEGVCVCMHV